MGHPVVGSGLEALLRLEDHYDVRRIARFDQAAALVSSWPPDVALVDGVLLRDDERPALGVPTLVLSGSAVDGQGLQQRLDDARGWLRKDPTLEELRAGIDRVLASSRGASALGRATLIAVLAASGVLVSLAWGYLALRSTG